MRCGWGRRRRGWNSCCRTLRCVAVHAVDVVDKWSNIGQILVKRYAMVKSDTSRQAPQRRRMLSGSERASERGSKGGSERARERESESERARAREEGRRREAGARWLALRLEGGAVPTRLRHSSTTCRRGSDARHPSHPRPARAGMRRAGPNLSLSGRASARLVRAGAPNLTSSA